MMSEKELIPYLFRTEYSKLVAVLCKTFGLSNIEFAEDIVSDTFLVAAETWGMKGLPDNPSAWLYTVAKNNARDQFRRKKIFDQKVKPEVLATQEIIENIDIDFSSKNIKDSQLRMMFSVCNPIISSESQVALALRVLCGFGISEIASAFITKKETINKRLVRAKDKLRKHNVDLAFPTPSQLKVRLDNVLRVVYLLFNEGYYSATSEQALSKELCVEAMRLNYLLLSYPATCLSKTNALMALLCFHASRMDARVKTNGEQVLYHDQDVNKWDLELIAKGEYYLSQSATDELSKYHLEAYISYWHTKPESTKAKWEQILQLYNKLLQIDYSPIVALNRSYALSKANSKEEAIKEVLKINLDSYHLYHSLLAELYDGVDSDKRLFHLNKALLLASTNSDKELIRKKMDVGT